MPEAEAPVVEFAPAKVNLFLHVLGRRPDGYHDLESLVTFADVGDLIEAWPASGFHLEIVGPFAEVMRQETDNLVLRTARALRDALGEGRGARLRLTKNLPVASGLGGGSSDAAATLRALERLWGRSLDPAARGALALSLGADVPVCLLGETCLMGGMGDVLRPIAAPVFPALLVNPAVALSTAEVFRGRSSIDHGPLDRPIPEVGESKNWYLFLEHSANDLQSSALRLRPPIGDILVELEGLPGIRLARMSGSGATCFGLFSRMSDVVGALNALRHRRPAWWIEAANLGGTRGLDPVARLQQSP